MTLAFRSRTCCARRGSESAVGAVRTRGRTGSIAARCTGIAHVAVGAATEHPGEGEEFNLAISEFQPIQLKHADMGTQIAAAPLVTWWAA